MTGMCSPFRMLRRRLCRHVYETFEYDDRIVERCRKCGHEITGWTLGL